MHKLIFLALGVLFGFILSRAGATTPDFYAGLFLFKNLQLLWVIGTAVVVGMIGVFALKALKAKALLGGDISFEGKPMTKTLIPGALLFGAGWGLSGACPGTALAMLGEGRLTALFVLAGILLGTWFYGVQQSRSAER